MKFQQLRYVVEIVNQNFNVTEAANALFTSQPGISKQVRLLESELGLEIFERNGKHIKGLTPPGKRIVAISRELMMKMQGIRSIADEYTKPDHGMLRIATTNTQYFIAMNRLLMTMATPPLGSKFESILLNTNP